ncbi:MAG: YdcF family protein [Proteocatella sp.]
MWYQWILFGIGLIFTIFSIYKEPRRFRNAILFILTLFLLFLSIAAASYDNSIFYSLVLMFTYGLVPMCMLLFSIALIASGFIMIKKEGKRLVSFLPIAFGSAIILGSVMFVVTVGYNMQKMPTWLIAGGTYFYLLVLYLAFVYVAFLGYSFVYRFLPKNKNYNYVIIHGCGLMGGTKVSPLLAGRLRKGIEAYRAGERSPKIIVSGGQGSDEKVSEASAMKEWLIENNICEEDIIVEDKSTTTNENLKYVKEFLDGKGEEYSCVFVTNDYHVFRTSLFARRLNFNGHGIGCKTAIYYWFSAFIREYIAILVHYKWVGLVYAVLCFVLLIVSYLPF